MSDTNVDRTPSPDFSMGSSRQSSVEANFFTTSTEASESNAWPSMPRNLPRSSAHGILDNTSLDPATFEPEIPQQEEIVSDNQLSLAQRRHLQRVQQEAEAREEQACEEQEAYERFLREQSADAAADEAGVRLRAHYRTQSAIEDGWRAAMQQFAAEDPQAFAAFAEHGWDCLIVGVSAVRYFALLRWYTHVPKAVRDAVFEISQYYNFECKLRVELARRVWYCCLPTRYCYRDGQGRDYDG